MKQKQTKYLVLSSLSIALLVFIIFSVLHFFVLLFEGEVWIDFAVLLLASLLSGLFLTFGLAIFSPTLTEAMAVLRRRYRFESLSHPLLLRLSYEAPGTYHHCLNVSNLAQKAAKAIGSDSFLVRIASYYHDIGKLENPFTFIENQAGSEIPTSFDAVSIKKNVQNIINHVENGILLAKKHNLSDEIIELIREHHGTTFVIYFYELAKEQGIKVKKTDFRYPGPTPHSKEAAILMLADSVEAAARAIPILTRKKIEGIVSSTIEEKLTDKQFINCPITDEEIARVGQSLIESLVSIYHQRMAIRKEE